MRLHYLYTILLSILFCVNWNTKPTKSSLVVETGFEFDVEIPIPPLHAKAF